MYSQNNYLSRDPEVYKDWIIERISTDEGLNGSEFLGSLIWSLIRDLLLGGLITSSNNPA